MKKHFGPTLEISKELHREKYRDNNETFEEACARQANALADGSKHFNDYYSILTEMRFLPGGRVQAAIGSPKRVTPYNCFVSSTIPDSMNGIMDVAKEAAHTMRLGGGIGYDFSTLRPHGDLIVSLDSKASGPVSFMGIFDQICHTISSSGHRRGAQMAVLRVDHPDIERFIRAKQDGTSLRAFNISVGITDEFMHCMENDLPFALRFGGRVYKEVDARSLWDEIMRSTWDYAEPGVLFIDTINRENPANYCETIAATNPCGEQPLPPNGACLLGSFNATKYLRTNGHGSFYFDYDQLAQDTRVVVRAMDNIIDRAVYPTEAQRRSAQTMRRMGLGITGLSNAIEVLGFPYGSPCFVALTDAILSTIAINAYSTSADLALEKGPFPLWNPDKYGSTVTNGPWARLPAEIREKCRIQGLRNSHLLSIAPTGTISLTADNVSGGIEPVFSLEFERVIQKWEGPQIEKITDWAYRECGVAGKTADKCTVNDHLNVLLTAQKWVDSACSKTCNIGDDVTWEQFKDVYLRAYKGGAKGCTTFRAAGKRMGILREVSNNDEEGMACTWDERGNRTCE